MRCEHCHGTGTITLPRFAGKPFGFLVLCPGCKGFGTTGSAPTCDHIASLQARRTVGPRADGANC